MGHKIIERELFLPPPPLGGGVYMLQSTVVAFLCLSCVSVVSFLVLKGHQSPILLASMGAASVIMFSAPKSPMGSLWAFIVGNLLSAIVGVTCAFLLPDFFLTGPLAVGMAIGCMHICRCQHPPGGATALVAVIGGETIRDLGYLYVLTPVGINVLLFTVVVVFHRYAISLIEERRQFGTRLQQAVSRSKRKESSPYNDAHLKQAIKHFGMYSDVSSEQLGRLVGYLDRLKLLESLDGRLCGDLSVKEEASIEYGSSLFEAWTQMKEASLNALVVVDKSGRVEGVVRLETLLELIGGTPEDDLAKKLEVDLAPVTTLHSDRPDAVGEIMEDVECVSSDCVISEVLLDIQSELCAVVDERKRYLGMVDISRNR